MEKEDLNELLFKAAIENDLELAELLIKKGADVNAKSWCGETPLHYAACYNSFKVEKLLIEQGGK